MKHASKRNLTFAPILLTVLPIALAAQARQPAPLREAERQSGSAQTSLSPEDAAERRKYLALMAGETAATAAARRQVCAAGKEAGEVREARASGNWITPDASETCTLVIRRQAHDGNVLDFYAGLVKDGGGTVRPEQILDAIADSAMHNKSLVPIGGQKAFVLTGAISFDAGYTKGVLDKVTRSSLRIADTPENARKLKEPAEACLDGDNQHPLSLPACYTAGYALAAIDNSPKAEK